MNGMEWLVLAGAALWALFFSDFKKEAWIGIASFAWLNVLTKAYNQDPEKWILQVVASWIEWISQYNIQLPDSLKNIDKAPIEGVSISYANYGTTSNKKGEYILQVPAEKEISIIVSSFPVFHNPSNDCCADVYTTENISKNKVV